MKDNRIVQDSVSITGSQPVLAEGGDSAGAVIEDEIVAHGHLFSAVHIHGCAPQTPIAMNHVVFHHAPGNQAVAALTLVAIEMDTAGGIVKDVAPTHHRMVGGAEVNTMLLTGTVELTILNRNTITENRLNTPNAITANVAGANGYIPRAVHQDTGACRTANGYPLHDNVLRAAATEEEDAVTVIRLDDHARLASNNNRTLSRAFESAQRDRLRIQALAQEQLVSGLQPGGDLGDVISWRGPQPTISRLGGWGQPPGACQRQTDERHHRPMGSTVQHPPFPALATINQSIGHPASFQSSDKFHHS